MEDDQRLNTLVHEGDILHFSLQHCKKSVKLLLRCTHNIVWSTGAGEGDGGNHQGS